MTDAAVSFAGNLTDDPELRHTDCGIAWARFRVASPWSRTRTLMAKPRLRSRKGCPPAGSRRRRPTLRFVSAP
jgi:single-stranded DNA-binding protein